MNRAHLKLTTALAAVMILAACGRTNDGQDTAVCTDRSGKRVDDRNCYRDGGGSSAASNAFLWYYLGRSSAVPAYGAPAYGGSFSAAPGHSYYSGAPRSGMTAAARSASISRGGFGATGHAFSSAGE